MSERNVPSHEGRALGENLARWADGAESRWRAELGFVPVRCPSCAFRKDSFPNGCLPTVADATKCLMEGRPFYCHHGLKGWREGKGEPQSVCAGWLMVGPFSEFVEAPWPFCT